MVFSFAGAKVIRFREFADSAQVVAAFRPTATA
jgi:hypothetical protein